MTTPDPTCNGDTTRWDSNGKREVPCNECDGTGEAGGGPTLAERFEAVRKAKLAAVDVYGIEWRDLEDVSKLELMLAALNPPTESVKAPEGWVLVPREATYMMKNAGAREAQRVLVGANMIWSAMVSAAPPAPGFSITSNDAVAKERERAEGLNVAPWLAEVFRRNGPCPTCGTLGMVGALEDAAIRSSAPDAGKAATDAASGGEK